MHVNFNCLMNLNYLDRLKNVSTLLKTVGLCTTLIFVSRKNQQIATLEP